MTFLVADLGGASCRAFVVREDGTVLGAAREPVEAGSGLPVGGPELDPEAAVAAVARTSRAALDAAGGLRPDAAGLSSMLAWVFLDGEGRPLGPAMTWADNRAAAEAAELEASIGGRAFYAVAGRRLSPDLLAPKLLWLERRERGTRARTARVLSLKDYLVMRLTGEVSTDRATASYTGLFDVGRMVPDEGLARAAGARPGLVPEARNAASIAGAAKGPLARAIGLAEGLPVAVGSVDGTTAMYGSGVLAPGVAALVSGTTDVLMASAASRPVDESMELTVNPSMVDGEFLAGGATGLSGGALSGMAALLGVELSGIEGAVSGIVPDPGAPIVLPGLGGERSPYWDPGARGGIAFLGAGHGRGDILRGLMEGTCYRLAAVLSRLAACGAAAERIWISGGGSLSESWNRLRADVTGLPVRRVSRTEATTAGTALFLEAAIGDGDLRAASSRRIAAAGSWDPDGSLAALYAGRRRAFEEVLRAHGRISRGEAWTR